MSGVKRNLEYKEEHQLPLGLVINQYVHLKVSLVKRKSDINTVFPKMIRRIILPPSQRI